MVIAGVNDLLFASKIRSAAAAAKAEVRFASTGEALLEAVRTLSPGLVLLDLNDRRIDPVGLLARLRSDPALSSLKVIGFVSHVQGELIAAARQAGIDEVLARSAFVARLPELLSAGLNP